MTGVRAEVGLYALQPLRRRFWLFQTLWRMPEGEALSSFAPQQSGIKDRLREGA